MSEHLRLNLVNQLLRHQDYLQKRQSKLISMLIGKMISKENLYHDNAFSVFLSNQISIKIDNFLRLQLPQRIRQHELQVFYEEKFHNFMILDEIVKKAQEKWIASIKQKNTPIRRRYHY